MKRLVAFDLDGTLAKSKSPLDAQMSGLLEALLGVVKVAIISGGAWSQFFAYDGAWKQLYSEDLSADDRTKVVVGAHESPRSLSVSRRLRFWCRETPREPLCL